MAAVFLDSITTEYHNGSAWVDITQYVVGDIKGSNGLGGWRPENRVAVLGTLNITINNKSKQFSPMGGDLSRDLSTLTGWNRGAKIRVRGTLQNRSEVIWTGRITSIDSDDLNWGNEHVRVMATDWMQVPVNYPMAGATIGLSKRIDEAMTTILSRLSVQPELTVFDTGNFTFPAVFDNVQRKTMALSEFTKLANSELGYIYVSQDGTLRVEKMLARSGGRALDHFWILPDYESFLLMEDGNFLLNENGGKFILDEGEYQNAQIYADMEKHNILLAEDGLLNASIIRTHPVITDTTLKVLYKLGTPLFIPEGQTVTFSAHYTDPSGLSQVSGTNMQSPIATTDYLSNTNQNGSGTNKTADLVVTPTYYGDVVDYSILNNADQPIWVTLLQARGYGIYYGNSIESTKEDEASQSNYGYAAFQFDQKYQRDTYLADVYGLSVIEEYKYPKSRITQMNFFANLNKNHLMSFLTLSIGSLILLTEDRSGISNHYYITDRSFAIEQGGIIHVNYGVKQNDSYLSGGLDSITVDFGGSGGDALSYGYLPHISNQSSRSVSFWVYPRSGNSTLIGYGLEYRILIQGNTSPYVRVVQTHSTTVGLWDTAANSMTLNAWNHVTVTHDTSSSSTAAPLVYINGVLKSLTTTSTPAGTIESETGVSFVVGNAYSSISDYVEPTDGLMFDARVYNRILTAVEAVTLYNAGVQDELLVADGVAFQGPAIYTDQARTFQPGHILTSTDRLVENGIRAVGIPHGSPVIPSNYTWVLRTTPNNKYYAVTWSSSLALFVAVGDSSGTTTHIATSPDGVTWTARTSPNSSYYGLTWSPDLSLFVAVGSSVCATSPDGVTWTARTIDSYSWQDVVWSPGLSLFVAVAGGRVATSSNGITWNSFDDGLTSTYERIAWSPTLSLFVMVRDADGGDGAATSTNGTSWTSHALPAGVATTDFYDIIWINELSLFVAVGDSAVITSTDGITWVSRTIPAKRWRSVAYSPETGLIVAVSISGLGSMSVYSFDGITWFGIDVPGNWAWYSISYSPALRRFVSFQHNTSNTTRAMTLDL